MTKARADLAPKSNEVKTRDVALYELESKFDLVEGHKHNGTDSPRVTFNDLINIDIDSPADGEVLRWDNSTSNWINNTLAEADIASATSFETHTLSTTSVHGIDDTSDLVLKSGSINQLADITSSGVIVEDAVSKRHVQNTDVGTSSTTFYLGLNGPRVKGNLGAVEIRNSNDSDYADLVVQNLTVKGTTTTIESETVTFTDNILTLNSSYTGSTPIENGGLEIERGTLTNAAIIWDESNDLWRAGLANTEKTLVRESNIVALTGDVTGSAVFNSVGNVSILTEVQDDSHNHIISNIDELQNILDNKSDTTHTHAINDLTDVVLSTISNGEVLVYDSVTVGWVNKTLDDAGIATATHDHDTTYLGINATAVNSDKLDGQDGVYYLNWSNFTNTPTTVSGYGITDAALESELSNHAASTTSVHGIVDTADIALKSGSVNQFTDVTSTGSEIEDAVSKKHVQNTDVGTSSPTFYIGTLGPKIKNNSGVVELKNNTDSGYTDIVVANVVANGRLEVERGELVNASLVWDETVDLWKAGVVGSEKTIATEGSSVELTGDVTGTATFNSLGNVSISTQVVDDSHNHIISNIDGLQDALDSKSDTTHTHDYVSKTGDVMTGALTAPDYYINNDSTRITEGLGDTVRLQTSSGYVDIGPQNVSYAHFQTDRNGFYFNKPLDAASQITVYGTNTFLSVGEGKIAGNIIWHAGNDGTGSGLDADLLDGNHASAFALSDHDHGNILNSGAIGTVADLPLITTTNGVITTGEFGSTAKTFCEGNDPRLSDARTPVVHDNTYHLADYITVSDITYESLNANGDIGTGDNQVARGNHTHILNALTDINISSVTNGELLVYDSATTEWVNQTLTEAGIAIATHDHDGVYMKDLVDDTSPQLGGELDAGENTIGFTERVNSSSSGSATIDWTKSNHQVITLTENTILTFTAPSKPCNLTLRVKQNATGGWTATIPIGKWPGGTVSNFSTNSNAEDILTIYYNGSEYYYQLIKGWA